jgi:hypothetical protein
MNIFLSTSAFHGHVDIEHGGEISSEVDSLPISYIRSLVSSKPVGVISWQRRHFRDAFLSTHIVLDNMPREDFKKWDLEVAGAISK